MHTPLIEKAEAYLASIMENVAQSTGAKDLAIQLGRRYNLPDDKLEALALAALFSQAGPGKDPCQ
ncbi:MAG: hypothetical protein IPN33_20470 [Saprospiraceae bacterium]|nr:hypothetical protein [Saprospiraceae bacterium]